MTGIIFGAVVGGGHAERLTSRSDL
jgi:hypothetical protein